MPLQRMYAVSNLLVIYVMFSAGVKSLLIGKSYWLSAAKQQVRGSVCPL
jgi:hypothetical protein